MLRICQDCTAAYSVGAPLCPQCGSERAVDEDTDPYRGGTQPMPKITKHGGPSYAADLPSEDDESSDGPESGGEQSSPGTSSQTSPEKHGSASKTNAGGASRRARTTERRTARARTEGSTAPLTDTARTEPMSGTGATDIA